MLTGLQKAQALLILHRREYGRLYRYLSPRARRAGREFIATMKWAASTYESSGPIVVPRDLFEALQISDDAASWHYASAADYETIGLPSIGPLYTAILGKLNMLEIEQINNDFGIRPSDNPRSGAERGGHAHAIRRVTKKRRKKAAKKVVEKVEKEKLPESPAQRHERLLRSVSNVISRASGQVIFPRGYVEIYHHLMNFLRGLNANEIPLVQTEALAVIINETPGLPNADEITRNWRGELEHSEIFDFMRRVYFLLIRNEPTTRLVESCAGPLLADSGPESQIFISCMTCPIRVNCGRWMRYLQEVVREEQERPAGVAKISSGLFEKLVEKHGRILNGSVRLRHDRPWVGVLGKHPENDVACYCYRLSLSDGEIERGCQEMPRINSETLSNACIDITRHHLVPCGIVRIGTFTNYDEGDGGGSRGGSLRELREMAPDFYVLSFGQNGYLADTIKNGTRRLLQVEQHSANPPVKA